MRVLLYGPSALAWWISCPKTVAAFPVAPDGIARTCTPTTRADAYVKSLYPHIRQPVHYISDKRHCDKQGRWESHASVKRYPRDSILQIESGVFAVRPELALIQSCRLLSQHQLLKAAGALCGQFFVDPFSPTGLGARESLTTKRHIASYAKRAAHLQGSNDIVRLLPFVPEKAASPPEVFLALALRCPSHLGGFKLPAPTLNERITPTRRAQRIAGRATLVPDLLWKNHRVALEFDSDAVHLERKQIARDASKRLALNTDRYKVVTITSAQLTSREALNSAAREIARHLGVRLRRRSQRFEEENARLFREGSSLDFLFQPSSI